MKQEVGEGKELKVEYLLVDLASFSSVKDFVRTFKEKNLPLHILVNNAAVCGIPYQRTEDDIDFQIQVNYTHALKFGIATLLLSHSYIVLVAKQLTFPWGLLHMTL